MRTLPAAAPLYDLDIAQYSGDWYAVVGASNDKGVYIYKNPQTPTTAVMSALPTPWRFMALAEPTHVSFSASAQYIMVESGQQFVVYDAENVRTIRFAALQPLDAPQQYATWMDGDRLTYVSGGKQVVFDYDYQNAQTLQAALPSFVPSFDPSYKYVFTLAPHATDAAQALLTDTSLLVTK